MFCPNCGATMEGSTCSYCGYSNSAAPVSAPVQPAVEVKAPENILLGSIGALIGALIGGAAIVLLLQINTIASLCGLLMAFLALKGYQMLAKTEPGTMGKIICLVIIAIVPFIAYRLGLAINLSRLAADEISLSLSIKEADSLVSAAISSSDGQVALGRFHYYTLTKADYIKDLVMLYLFTALGAGSTIFNMFKKK